MDAEAYNEHLVYGRSGEKLEVSWDVHTYIQTLLYMYTRLMQLSDRTHLLGTAGRNVDVHKSFTSPTLITSSNMP